MSGRKRKIQCHFISNTHRDREWRFSMRRTRHMLVRMMDMLFDVFEKEPNFRHFHTLRRIFGAPVRFNGGFAASQAVTSPVKRQRAEFALPGRSRERWRRVCRVNLLEIGSDGLSTTKDGWVKVAIPKKKILTVKFGA